MNTIWIVLPVLLVLMFQLGIELDGAAFRRVAKHPKALFVGLAGQLLLLPAAAFAVGTLFRLPPVLFFISWFTIKVWITSSDALTFCHRYPHSFFDLKYTFWSKV